MKRTFVHTKTGELVVIDDESKEYKEFQKKRLKDEYMEWFTSGR